MTYIMDYSKLEILGMFLTSCLTVIVSLYLLFMTEKSRYHTGGYQPVGSMKNGRPPQGGTGESSRTIIPDPSVENDPPALGLDD